MSFPKYQGNSNIRGVNSADSELRKLEKPALDSNQFDGEPAPNPAVPPDNPSPDQEAPSSFTIVSFSPESTFESRVFQVSVQFSAPIDDMSTLPTRLPVNLESVNAVWSEADEKMTTFIATVGELGSELPNNASIQFDFTNDNFGLPGVASGGDELSGQTLFTVAVSYPV